MGRCNGLCLCTIRYMVGCITTWGIGNKSLLRLFESLVSFLDQCTRLGYGSMAIETNSFETTFIWGHNVWDNIHFRPIHLRPLHLRRRSFETWFISNHIHLRPHSLEWSCFDLLWITFLWSTFHSSVEDLNFCMVTIHLKFCKIAPFRIQRWLTLVCKCTRTLKHRRGQKTLHTSGLEGSVAPLKCHIDQAKELFVLRSWPFPLSRRHNSFSI